jgi:hypothetical protein
MGGEIHWAIGCDDGCVRASVAIASVSMCSATLARPCARAICVDAWYQNARTCTPKEGCKKKQGCVFWMMRMGHTSNKALSTRTAFWAMADISAERDGLLMATLA